MEEQAIHGHEPCETVQNTLNSQVFYGGSAEAFWFVALINRLTKKQYNGHETLIKFMYYILTGSFQLKN